MAGLLDNSPPKAVGSAIDPRTGKPYVFSTNGSGGEGVWIKQGTNMSGANAMGLGGYNGTDGGGENLNDITPYALNQTAWLKTIGAPGVGSDLYNGNQVANGSGENFAGLDSTGKLEAFMKSQGLTLAEQSGDSTGQNRVFQAFNAQNQPVGSSFKVKDNEDAFQIAVLALGAGAGALAAGGAGVGAGVGAEGGTGVSAVLPGEIGGATEAGYGGIGAVGADGGADAALEEAGMSGGGQGATNAALADSAAGSPGYGVSSAGAGGGAGNLAGIVGPTVGGGGLLSGLTGPGVLGQGGGLLGSTLGDGSGVLGSGLSLGQVGGLVGAAGGLLGQGTGLNSATNSTQNQIDPNLKPYVYGANGLIPQANSLLQSQMATGGLNANQTAGLNSQLAVLNNPNYSAGFNQAKTLGQSLMGQGVASNPFTSGQSSLMPSPYQAVSNGAGLLPDPNQRRTIQPVRQGLLGA